MLFRVWILLKNPMIPFVTERKLLKERVKAKCAEDVFQKVEIPEELDGRQVVCLKVERTK